MKTWRLAPRLFMVTAIMSGIPALCQCTPTSKETMWGGNMRIVIMSAKPMRSLHGIVGNTMGAPLTGVLVEVYDHPETLLRSGPPLVNAQGRITGCTTNETGQFSFKVPPGNYDLRFSNSYRWDVTSVYVRVRKLRLPSRRGLIVRLTLGT